MQATPRVGLTSADQTDAEHLLRMDFCGALDWEPVHDHEFRPCSAIYRWASHRMPRILYFLISKLGLTMPVSSARQG